MSSPPGVEASSRTPLTRDRIVEAAMRLVDQDGIEVLSMRRLGSELGVEAMSLYNHVAGKDEILLGMIDAVFAQLALPQTDTDWPTAIRSAAIAGKEVFTRHPWVVPLVVSRTTTGQAAIGYMDAMLGVLRRAGFDVESAHHAWHLIVSHVLGYAFQEAGSLFDQAPQHSEEDHRRFFELAADYPYVLELAPQLEDCSHDEEFRFGLDVIIAGLERRLKA